MIKIFTAENIHIHRKEICKQCDQLNAMNFCKSCGCWVPAKVHLVHADCPLKKWPEINEEGTETK